MSPPHFGLRPNGKSNFILEDNVNDYRQKLLLNALRETQTTQPAAGYILPSRCRQSVVWMVTDLDLGHHQAQRELETETEGEVRRRLRHSESESSGIRCRGRRTEEEERMTRKCVPRILATHT